jgi:hypothetical protein
MSSTSTGAGDAGHAASAGWGSSCWGSVSRCRRLDMCGSRFALFADPSTNTNFASRSLAMV